MDDQNLLTVRDLSAVFNLRLGPVRAVDSVDLDVPRGKTLCIVGESGSGKSITARSILQIVAKPSTVSGSMIFRRTGKDPVDLAKLDPKGSEIRAIRGRDIAMIFQEPMNSLSPVHPIGEQIIEKIMLHHKVNRKEAEKQAADSLGRVGIPDPHKRLMSYPFELSGGMRQRAMIAMALSCKPELLIADEPTTALDVTTQANILKLIEGLQRETKMTVIFITHDLGVVAEIAEEVAVMYLGRIVERGSVEDIYCRPQHPYTLALLSSIPKLGARRERGQRLYAIKGMVPHAMARPKGCPFHTRCQEAVAGLCDTEVPASVEITSGHYASCHLRKPETASRETKA